MQNLILPFLGLCLYGVYAGGTGAGTTTYPGHPGCKCAPTDACWPSASTWNTLNSTVGGRLIKSTPLAGLCHTPNFDAQACAALQEEWYTPELHINTSSSMNYALFAGDVCSPFTPPNATCGLGREVQYAINVSGPADVVAGLAFVKAHNIRLVVRNTGHDLLGKSTGYGALALWTHHLKDIEFFDKYPGPGAYQGPAVKIGAGVQGFEAYAAADKENRTIVGGECPTVGLAGGYIAGGGHSALASIYGLAADSALAFEVVTAEGELVHADARHNSDLKWALAGGGGGTYGVVLSVTIKTHDPVPAASATLQFSPAGISNDTFWKGIAAYMLRASIYTSRGGFVDVAVSAAGFILHPLYMPRHSVDEVKALFQPVLTDLESLGIPYLVSFTSYQTYLEAYNDVISYDTSGDTQFGSRLIPRNVVSEDPAGFMAALRMIVEAGGGFFDAALNVGENFTGTVDNAVLPAWRKADRHLCVVAPYNSSMPQAEIDAASRVITDVWDKSLKALAPDSGAYLNEADVNDPDWKKDFYGENYDRLLAVKRKYDPGNVFYARTAVGSDAWKEMPDGRLCPAER